MVADTVWYLMVRYSVFSRLPFVVESTPVMVSTCYRFLNFHNSPRSYCYKYCSSLHYWRFVCYNRSTSKTSSSTNEITRETGTDPFQYPSVYSRLVVVLPDLPASTPSESTASPTASISAPAVTHPHHEQRRQPIPLPHLLASY
jgi:hypothetical protein